MQLTCPCCKAHIPLQAALEDDAGRELIAMLAAMPSDLALPLVHYLGLFRPAKQQLGWGRALRLAREVMALPGEGGGGRRADLVVALVEANRALDEKRAQAGWKPLGNHNYLRRVLEGVAGRAAAPAGLPVVEAPAGAVVASSKTGRGLMALEALKR